MPRRQPPKGARGRSRGLRSYIKTLRQKLEPDPRLPRYLITEPGVGYRLMADEDERVV